MSGSYLGTIRFNLYLTFYDFNFFCRFLGAGLLLAIVSFSCEFVVSRCCKPVPKYGISSIEEEEEVKDENGDENKRRTNPEFRGLPEVPPPAKKISETEFLP